MNLALLPETHTEVVSPTSFCFYLCCGRRRWSSTWNWKCSAWTPSPPSQEVNFNIIIVMLKVNPMNFNNLQQHWDKNGNNQAQKARSEGINMKRPELRMPVLYQRLLVYKLEKLNCPPESTTRNQETELQGQLQSLHREKITKQFDEHQKSGVGAAIADVKPRQQSLTDKF